MSKKDLKRQDSIFTVYFYSLLNKLLYDIKNRKNNKLNGYFTVEASLVFPIILGILMFLIFLMFFLHGRVVMSANSYAGAIYSSNLKEDELNMYLNQYRGFHHSKRDALGIWFGNAELQNIGNRTVAQTKASMFIPMLFISSGENTKVNIKGIAAKSEAVKIIRNTRMAEDVLDLMGENKENSENDEKNNGKNKIP